MAGVRLKLTLKQISDIKRKINDGQEVHILAKEYGVIYPTIYNIYSEKCYKKVLPRITRLLPENQPVALQDRPELKPMMSMWGFNPVSKKDKG